ncbi:hypothetical protein NECAME_05594 [Necator americanus]|uniref:Atos-like conserved domain-containing protein n=1 Tax=Necator americanus TaxID=51031 RepID=W2SI05_NECAM|nr:hypothetical protein NECAME_05594 [Necator americanus]ETN68511.1 hypothetical protein NECAME_05594 [Necator americanus]
MSDVLTAEIVQLIAAARAIIGTNQVPEEALPIDEAQLSDVNIEIIVAHSSCGKNCSRAIPVELWTIRREWDSQQTGLAPLFLKNAIRSHLHFSQLNSWVSTLNGRMPDGVCCTYRICSHECELGSVDVVTEHTFPVCRINRQSILVVSVKYIKGEKMPLPVGLCLTLGGLVSDQWLVPSPVGSPADDSPLTHSTEDIAISSLKHKPLSGATPPSPDGPSPKFAAVAGPHDERPARRVLSACSLSSHQEDVRNSKEIDILVSRLQTIQGERGRQRTKSGGSVFNKVTGLPLHSSPAPLFRQRNSLSASDIVLPDSRINRHQPGSLLGNFEESALNGRLDPVKRLEGFKLQLAASGAFSSPHTSLPVTAYFFDLNDSETAPSPYLGTCSLESLGKRGYRVPKQGIIQATLFNPQDTVVKVFVVAYDMTDMPPSSQTFIRQRTFLSNDDEMTKVDKHLVNLIHFRQEF